MKLKNISPTNLQEKRRWLNKLEDIQACLDTLPGCAAERLGNMDIDDFVRMQNEGVIYVQVTLSPEVYNHYAKKYVYHNQNCTLGDQIERKTMDSFCSKQVKQWFNKHFEVDAKGNQGIVEFDDERYPNQPALSSEHLYFQGKQPGNTESVRIKVASEDFYYLLGIIPDTDEAVTGETILRTILIHLYVENKNIYG